MSDTENLISALRATINNCVGNSIILDVTSANEILSLLTAQEDANKYRLRLVRELDVLLNGEDGAAKQASLCDIVSQVAQIVRESGRPLLKQGDNEKLLNMLLTSSDVDPGASIVEKFDALQRHWYLVAREAMASKTATITDGLIDVLENSQYQIDHDGTFIGVSRQALSEAIDILKNVKPV